MCEPIKGLYGYLVCRPSTDPEPDSFPMLSGVPKSKSCGTMNITILSSVSTSFSLYGLLWLVRSISLLLHHPSVPSYRKKKEVLLKD